MRTKSLIAATALVASAALAACASDESAPEPSSRTPATTATQAPPTPLATPTIVPPTAARTNQLPACAPPYPTASPAAFCADPARLEAATLDDVIDGDTIDVLLGGARERVRLFGVDAPERGDRCAREATARVAELTTRGVRLRSDVRSRDSYGRLLRYVYTPDGLSVDAMLIAEGLAFAWTRDGELRDELVAVEGEARANGRGCLW